MRFAIRRVSSWSEDVAPVKGAVNETFTRIDRRTARPKDIPAYKNLPEDWWYAEGENHREEFGPRGGFAGIARDFPGDASAWFIEINSLNELLQLQDREGQLILTWNDDGEPIREIKIYDGYNE